ncbi:MAG TPA: S53 family peptidase [Terriglobia bacterium]|nr:S53 family peptidase [Terriglobia bacterium]
MNRPFPAVKMILSACLSIATGFGAPELPHAVRVRGLMVPESSVVRPQDVGLRAHTNHVVVAPDVPTPEGETPEGATPNAAGTALPPGESPSALRAIYQLPATGGAGMIALVDAYDDPTAEHDLGTFSSKFGLPACTTANRCFSKVYAAGPKPAANCGWAQEADLDIEWAHALAPNAKIVLVEAASNNSNDLGRAVDVAGSIVNPSGRGSGEVSMSWGFGEFSGETSFDAHLKHAGVVYVASSGDVGGMRTYPATSPYAVAAGGTSLHFNTARQFTSETAWSSSGGGPSLFEPRPSYQTAIVTVVGGKRGTPDLAFDSDPNSGVSVYDSTPCQNLSGWLIFGGTSVAAPSIAAIINLAGNFHSSSSLELGVIYSYRGTTHYRDITSGRAGNYSATKGWDFTTGVGSSLGIVGK